MRRRNFLQGAALAGVGGSALAAPAVAQSRKTMTIVSTWPRDFPGIGTSAQRLADRITSLSEGRLTTEYFAAGERVGAFDVFDEVASGNSQAYSAADYFWIGKHPAFAYFTTVPFGMTTPEFNAWVRFGGGQALWDELSGEFGLKALPASSTGAQSGGWFNKEINGPDDLKGLKMRIPGIGGTVLSKLGVSTVSLPGGQIYENLVSGAVDAADWIGPYNDYFLKLYEAARYYYTAGMHEPGAVAALSLNKDWWETLSTWEKQVIEAATTEELAASHDEVIINNRIYLQRLVEDHGVETRAFTDETWEAFGDAAGQVFEETRGHSALAEKIDRSFQSSLREIGGFMNQFEYAFLRQRNRVLGI